MTAACTLCGQILTAVTDIRGPLHTLKDFGAQFGKHVQTKHADVFPQILHMIGESGIAVQGLVFFSYLKSEDQDFKTQVQQMREVVDKACAQKEPAPIVTVV